MIFSNRTDSRITYNSPHSIPITTRNFMQQSNLGAKCYVNRSTNASVNSLNYLPPIAKAISLDPMSSSTIFDNNQWRQTPKKQQEQDQLPLNKPNQLPKINGKLFTYFPKAKPYIQEDQLVKYDLSLFDTRIFKKIKFDDFKTKTEKINLMKLNGKEYAFDLGNDLILRSLKIDDVERDYLKLFEDTNTHYENAKEKFEDKFFEMKTCPNTYYIIVIEDLMTNKVIGTATLFNELKFLYNGSSRGRIEDVAIDEKYRGFNFDKLLIDFIIDISKIIGCYKISIECDDNLKSVYQEFEYVNENDRIF